MVCAEELERHEARDHLLAWCVARPAEEAADELLDAMVDDDDPDVWDLGFEALAMIDPVEAGRAVHELRSDPRWRTRATAWLRRHRPWDPPPRRPARARAAKL